MEINEKKNHRFDSCSIFSKDGHVFREIKNPSIDFVQVTIRNNHGKFHQSPFTSFRGEDVRKMVENGCQMMAIAKGQVS